MYALASLGLRCSAGGFCVAGAALGAVQGVGCTPWRPLVSAGFCVAGAALGALQGVGCTPWRPLVSAWQAWYLMLCKGSDVRPGVPWSPLLCRWLLRGRRGTWCSARVGCTPWRPLVSAGFCVAGAALGALQKVGCTPWRPLVSVALPVAFAWQAQHLVLCKGSDVRPGVPWSPLLCRWLLRGRRSTWCSARGRMYALVSLGLCRSAGAFCVAGAALGALQGCHSHSLTPTHSLTHSLPLTHSLTHSLTHALTHSLSHSHSLTHFHSLTLPHSLIHSLSHPSHTHTPHSHHSLTLSLTHLYMHIHTHTCSEIAYRIIDVECIVRAKTPQLNLTGKNCMTQRDIQCEVSFLRPCSKDQLVLMQLSLE